MKRWRHAIWWALALILGTFFAAAVATHRPLAGIFEAPLPVPKGGQTRIAELERRIAQLESDEKLTAQLRRQLNRGLEVEQLLQAGAVTRLTLNAGTARLEYVSPGALPTTTAPELS